MPSRPGLNGAAVTRAAAELLDAAGGREVTMAEIAARLGVKTPSLYNHIGGQDELRRELAILGVRELGERIARAAIGKAGDNAILAIAASYRAFAQERPGLYLATLRAPGAGDEDHAAAGDEVLAVLRLVLEPWFLVPEDQIHAIRALRSLLHGFVSLERAGGFGLPVDLDDSYRWLLALFTRGLRGDGATIR